MKTYWKNKAYNLLCNCNLLRLHIYKSLKNIYIQIIDDNKGLIILSTSTIDKRVKSNRLQINNSFTDLTNITNIIVGDLIRNKISKLIFDSNKIKTSNKIKYIVSSLKRLNLKIN